MANIQNTKKYDLEERTLEFGKRIIRLAKAIPKNTINNNLGSFVNRVRNSPSYKTSELL